MSDKAASSDYTILVADDEPENLDMFCRALRGYNVLRATRADECLVLLGEHRVDIVLTDFRMPGGSGADVLERARMLNPLGKRIIISAYADPETLIRAINKGGVERFLVKPVAPQDVRRAVDEMVEEMLVMRDQVDDLAAGTDERRLGERRAAERRKGDRRIPGSDDDDAEMMTVVERIDQEIARSHRYGRIFTLVILPGHDGVETVLRGAMRKSDLVFDYGADVVCLLTETPPLEAKFFCDRVAATLPGVTLRTASYPDDGTTATSLLALAR